MSAYNERQAVASEVDYQQTVLAWDRTALLQWWRRIQSDDTPGWPPGKAFEYMVVRAFHLEGAEVRWPYEVRSVGPYATGIVEQIDGVVYSDGLACLVQSKDWSRQPVDVEPIAKLRYQLSRRPAGTLGVVFSRTEFTEPAKMLAVFAAPQVVLLWNGRDLDRALTRGRMCYALLRKYRACVEEGQPDYMLRVEELS